MAPVVNQPYFVPHNPGTSVSVRDAGDDGVDVDEIPASVDPDDFAPKLLNFVVRHYHMCQYNNFMPYFELTPFLFP